MNGKQVIKKLNQHGWEKLRIRGSHHQLGKGDQGTTVPVHGKQDFGAMSIQYKAIITQEENGGFFVQFPTINEAFTEGKTLSDSLINAQEVLNLSLEGRLEDGIEIPPPNLEICTENEYLIAPEASIQSALLIHFNRGNLAPIELRSLEKLAKIMGKKLIVDFA